MTRKKSKSNGDDEEKEEWYIPYSTIPYPQEQHPSIDGEFWSCSCSYDVADEDELILCGICEQTLSHKDCFDIGVNDVYECPRCKYYANWREENNVTHEWNEEDNIRLIVLCSEGLSMHAISKSMNRSTSEIHEKIEELIDDERVRYGGKDSKRSKDHRCSFSKKEIKLIGVNPVKADTVVKKKVTKKKNKHKKQLNYWTVDEDDLLLELTENLSGKIPIQTFREILPGFNLCADTERSAGAMQNRHRLLMKEKKKKRKRGDRNSYDYQCLDNKGAETISQILAIKTNDVAVQPDFKDPFIKIPKKKRRRMNDVGFNDTGNIFDDVQLVANNVNNNNKEKLESVENWLRNTVKLPQYLPIFIDEGYDDMDTIIYTLTDADLIDIGIEKRGHRNRIMMFVKQMKNMQ